MKKTILAVKEGCLSKEAELKLNAMRESNIDIRNFLNSAILNFNIDLYLKKQFYIIMLRRY